MIFWEKQSAIKAFYLKNAKPVCEQYGLTQIEFDILTFFTHNTQLDTAADVVRVRHLTKSHVSAALKDLEDRGLIEKYHRENNRKSLHLRITEKGAVVAQAAIRAQGTFFDQLFAGFTAEELDQCRDLFERLCENVEIGMQDSGETE